MYSMLPGYKLFGHRMRNGDRNYAGQRLGDHRRPHGEDDIRRNSWRMWDCEVSVGHVWEKHSRQRIIKCTGPNRRVCLVCIRDIKKSFCLDGKKWEIIAEGW